MVEVLLLDNGTPGLDSVMTTDVYDDPWPLPTCSHPDLHWGLQDGKAFCDNITEAYNDIIHWKRNIFCYPPVQLESRLSRRLLVYYRLLRMAQPWNVSH